ncbi:MAG: peptidylprolyl isomerase, partial [Flavobacteriaceae bacterium]|nr:peptidylprolyl isomerase [Flavobacteriaceae bacterium]
MSYLKLFTLLLVANSLLMACTNKTTIKKHSQTDDKTPDAAESSQHYTDSIRNLYLNKKPDTIAINIPKVPQDSLHSFFKNYLKQETRRKVRLTTKYGSITLKLYEQTPLHSGSFLFLAHHGYFDHTIFHRSIPGFILQGGNNDQGVVGSYRLRSGKYLLPPEFKPSLKNLRGKVAATTEWENNPQRLQNPYEFFILLKDAPHLDNEHT